MNMETALQRQAEQCLGTVISPHEWVKARANASQKLARIIARDGDENGARREPWYLAQLVAEAVREGRIASVTYGLRGSPPTGRRKKGVKKDGPCPKT